MFVCLCYGITDTQIQNAVTEHGIGNIRELKERLRVGTQCGSCIDMAASIIDKTIMNESLFKDVG